MSAKSLQSLDELKLNTEEHRALQWLLCSAEWEGPHGENEHYNAVLPIPPEGTHTLLAKLDEAGLIKRDFQNVDYIMQSDGGYIVFSKKNLQRLGIKPHTRGQSPEPGRTADHFRNLTASKLSYGLPAGQSAPPKR